MDMMIDQIENNKNLITKSANKLIALLDVSQWCIITFSYFIFFKHI